MAGKSSTKSRTSKSTPNKPSYLGTLNAIAVGERGGHEIFSAWSAATKDRKLKPVLDMIAVREMEHSWAFTKRLSELGFDVKPAKRSKSLAKTVKLMKSKSSDADKFAAFGIGVKKAKSSAESTDESSETAADGLLQLLADKSIDPRTGGLLGRFICEERDSGAQLTSAYRSLQRRAAARKRKKG